MSAISTWSTTAASNNSASPDGFPEGMAPSGVNDSARELMAAIRTQFEDAEWLDWGDTTTYVAATQFQIASSDVTSRYRVGRRVRAVGSSTGTIYGGITASSFSTNTTVTVSWDSGSLQSEALTISLGIAQGDRSLPAASTTHKGVVESATSAEAIARTSDKAVTADLLSDVLRTETAQATTSGTAFDFTGIPAGTKQVIVELDGVTLSGTNDLIVQIGDSGGIETTSYTSGTSGGGVFASSTSGFIVKAVGGTAVTGHIMITNITGDTWVASHSCYSGSGTQVSGGGTKTLSGTLTQFRLTRTASDTFTAGSVNGKHQ